MATTLYNAITALVTALGNITTANGYTYSLGNASGDWYGAPSAEQVAGGNPQVYIASWSDETVKRTGTMRTQLTVDLIGILPSAYSRTLNDVWKLQADIEKALYADETLGGKVGSIKRGASTGRFDRMANVAVLNTSYTLDVIYTEGTP